MQITIHNEAGRRAAVSALWRQAADGIGESLRDELLVEARSALDPDGDTPDARTKESAALLADILQCVERVKAAEVGTVVMVPGPVEAFRDALTASRDSIAASEDLWELSREDRDVRLATYDVLLVLLDKLPKPAAVVA